MRSLTASLFGLLLPVLARAQNEDEVVLERRWLPFDLDGILNALPDPLWPWLLAAAAVGGAGLEALRRRRHRRSEWTVTRIVIEMPGHDEVAGSASYAVSADPPPQPEGDARPRASFRVRVFVARPGETEQPADDGTGIELAVRSEGRVVSQATLLVREQVAVTGSSTTLGGTVEGAVRCGPAVIEGVELAAAPAARWRLVEDGIDYIDAAEFVLQARASSGAASAEVRFRVVAGRAAALELLSPDALPPQTLPDGLPPEGGRFIDVSEVRYSERPWWVLVPTIEPLTRVQSKPMRFGIGGWARSRRRGHGDEFEDLEIVDASGAALEPLPGKVLRLLGAVSDAAGNPVPLADDENPGARVDLALGAKSVAYFTRPFGISRDNPTVARDAAEVNWRCHPDAPTLPDNVFLVHVVPAVGAATAKTDIVFGLSDGGAEVGRWCYRFTDRPAARLARAVSWFATGDPEDGWHYLAEIGVSLIPLVGDGRDLLIYGKKRINGERLSAIDHAVALLALGGFLLDLAPGNPADVAAAGAKTTMKMLKKIPAEPGLALAKAIRGHLEKGMPNVEGLGDLPKLATSGNLETLRRAVADLGRLGEVLRKLEVEHARKLLSVLGAAVAVVQLEPLIEIAARFAYDEVLDLFEGLEKMEEP
jgi:hypothetical protein